MRTLYHLPICPFSRAARIALSEKKIEFTLLLEKPWEERDEFIHLNPAGDLPVFVDTGGETICPVIAIFEYLEEVYPEGFPLFPGSPQDRAETRRLLFWMNQKFHAEVTIKLVWEKVIKKQQGKGWPDTAILRQGSVSLHHHLQYLTYLLEKRDWMAGRYLSAADIMVAAHLSAIDFIGSMSWDRYPLLKNWYATLKSRPSFRPILADHYASVTPPAHYTDLDF
jgi:glutathione S-transferase